MREFLRRGGFHELVGVVYASHGNTLAVSDYDRAHYTYTTDIYWFLRLFCFSVCSHYNAEIHGFRVRLGHP